VPAGCAAGHNAQLLPFQASASAVGYSWLLSRYEPTATQEVADSQETPDSDSLRSETDGFAVGCVVQLLPFRRSASETVLPLESSVSPTAVQTLGEAHDTALSTPQPQLLGLGVGSIVQALPFQASARVA
jgi:hypothetical protein